YTIDVVARLDEAYAADRAAMAGPAIEFASRFDVRRVFAEHWVPVLASLEAPPEIVRPEMQTVDVLVPMVRDRNRDRLVCSFEGTAPLTVNMLEGDADKTYGENVNALVAKST